MYISITRPEFTVQEPHQAAYKSNCLQLQTSEFWLSLAPPRTFTNPHKDTCKVQVLLWTWHSSTMGQRQVELMGWLASLSSSAGREWQALGLVRDSISKPRGRAKCPPWTSILYTTHVHIERFSNYNIPPFFLVGSLYVSPTALEFAL